MTEKENIPKQEPGVYQEKLAEIRTKQANERTLLAYIRTSLTLFVAGLTFVKFFDIFIIAVMGWILMPLAIVNLAVGIFRYRNIRNHIEHHHI